MGKESQVQQPNYTAAAQEQGVQSQQLAAQQTAANRPNVNTPWGNLSYTTAGGTDPATGTAVTNYTENVGLTPQEQTALSSQQNIQSQESSLGNNLLQGIGSQINSPSGVATPQTPMSGAGQGVNYNPGSMDPAAEQAVWGQFENLQEPLMAQQSQQTGAQLAAQGLKPGDPAYDTAMANLRQSQGTQRQTAMDSAVGAGESEAATLFGEGNQAQAQGFGQGATQQSYNNNLIGSNISNQAAELGLTEGQQTQDVNLLNGLLNGQQVGMPQFPGTTSASSGNAPNLLQAAELSGQGMLDQYNASTSSSNAGLGALAGLGSAAIIAASDERMKTDIKRVGETDDGVPIHTYRYKGDPMTQMGVMAQQLRKKKPSAVHQDPHSGMLGVDYARVS